MIGNFTSHIFTEVPFLQQDYLNNAMFNPDNYLLTLRPHFQSLSLKKVLNAILKAYRLLVHSGVIKYELQ